MQIAILVMSGASLACSATTLLLVLGGSKMAINEVQEVKTRTNEALDNVKAAVEAMKF